ncbi:flagellar biosynthesis protein FlhB [Citricoccus sp. K5]|uniref:EscU/YscU/HrcU family type III secretion system export apparatus switch protein n=1 Tax=Citricoccus sp. K5 TaxID=2653135 RepID=UPI0012EF3E28|nr:EscU/YscU/HrcU family type III secretion system export apparatus switch protein [Citricoccus sp. K5]VXB63007.1 Flagellar biosynthesis protein FlhB [Citricoccus sp. K5]
MSSETGERTEQASDRQMREVRKKGKLGRSTDVSAWVVVAAVAVMVPMTILAAQGAATDSLFQITRAAQSGDPQVALQVLAQAGGALGASILPLMAVAMLAAVATPFLQGPVTFRSLAPKFDHFNPVSAAQKILGPQAWWNAAKALAKSAAVGLLMYWVIQAVATGLMGAGLLPLEAVTSVVSTAALQLLWFSVLAGLVMAAADVFVVAKRNRKQTKVTKDEAKREHKSSDGDPLVKSQRRSRQLSMSRNRMISEVSSADAVVVNPVHVAVALRYKEGDAAPVVVAAGKGEMAARIRERAVDAEVPLVKNIGLAWMMHDHCRIGAPVPEELYGAVAVVIAFTLKLDAKLMRRRRGRIHDLGDLRLPEGFQRPASPDN